MRTSSFLRSAACACLMTSLAAPPAFAQTTGDKAAAEALFQAGRTLMNDGKFAEACGKLEASQRLDAGLGTLLYLADCYEKAGRLASAWATFREAESIAMGRSDSSRSEVARQRYTALEPRLAKLWIKVADGNPADVVVTRDGEPVPHESFGLALPTDTGEHLIEAKATGRKSWSSKVMVPAEAANVEVAVPLLEAAPEAPKTESTPLVMGTTQPGDTGQQSTPGHSQRLVGIIMGGAGIIGLGVSGLFTLKAKSKNDDSKKDDHCPGGGNVCDAEGTALRNDAFSSARSATAFGIAGGVLLASGIVVYFTAPSGKKATAKGPQLDFDASPTLARVGIRGSF